MAINYVKLMDPVVLNNGTAAAVYANPVGTKTMIGGFWVHNTNASTREVTMFNVPDAAAALGTPGATNQFYKVTLAALETMFVEMRPPVLLTDENDAIFGFAGGTAVNAQICGSTITS